MVNRRSMPSTLPMIMVNFEKIFDPLYYVVDVEGSRYSENLGLEVKTIEELEQVVSVQCRRMGETVSIAVIMQVCKPTKPKRKSRWHCRATARNRRKRCKAIARNRRRTTGAANQRTPTTAYQKAFILDGLARSTASARPGKNTLSAVSIGRRYSENSREYRYRGRGSLVQANR